RHHQGQRKRPLRLVSSSSPVHLTPLPSQGPGCSLRLPRIDPCRGREGSAPRPKPATCPLTFPLGTRELHVFRGLETPEPGFIFGHEFTGTVVEAGAGVESVKVGDKVVSPFTVSW